MEKHSLKPFIPDGIKILMLGSFPPKKEKWTMEFYYPNFTNDMWRIFGLVFFDDKGYFLDSSRKKFDKQKIIEFLSTKNIGISDSAQGVIRQKDNASDKFLQVVEVLDFENILSKNPTCDTLISTGEKSAEIIREYFELDKLPKMGECVEFAYKDKIMYFYRVPSSSRAYPKSIEYKSEIYKSVFKEIGAVLDN